MTTQFDDGIEIEAEIPEVYERILTPEALSFLSKLHRTFNATRAEILISRIERKKEIDKGVLPDFLPETESVRNNTQWKIGSTPPDLEKRFVEITGPTERKMMINAFNSGANIFMADFEDSISPTWERVLEGQINLCDAVNHTLTMKTEEGKEYKLNEKIAVLMVRPRGWHLVEKHFLIEGSPMSASLFDFGLFFFHNAHKLIQKGSAPYFYLPKLESYLEARLWNDVFLFAQKELSIPTGTIKATVLIETILAAFEMDEILWELKEHSAGLNAGRWDYIFSIIKKFNFHNHFVFPDRIQISMTVPFMKAYTELLVETCHKRGAHAIGGMAANIPSRKDKEVNEISLQKVREDKLRESQDGFDGTWVAHPDLVPVAMGIFEKALGNKPNQKNYLKKMIHSKQEALLNFTIPDSQVTENGIRLNISVALQYLESWLRGTGAVGIFNMMEDAATAEISRAQLWQWIHSQATLKDGRKIDEDLFNKILNEEFEKIQSLPTEHSKLNEAKKLLETIVLNKQFEEFLTLSAYDQLA
jgi:malate synthase